MKEMILKDLADVILELKDIVLELEDLCENCEDEELYRELYKISQRLEGLI